MKLSNTLKKLKKEGFTVTKDKYRNFSYYARKTQEEENYLTILSDNREDEVIVLSVTSFDKHLNTTDDCFCISVKMAITLHESFNRKAS